MYNTLTDIPACQWFTSGAHKVIPTEYSVNGLVTTKYYQLGYSHHRDLGTQNFAYRTLYFKAGTPTFHDKSPNLHYGNPWFLLLLFWIVQWDPMELGKWHFTLFIIAFYCNINSLYRIIISFYRIIIAIYRNNYSDISTYYCVLSNYYSDISK